MKKALAVLLAIVMAFSVCVVCVSAEASGETAAGTTYTWSGTIPRVNAKDKDDATEVLILQGGDVIEFGEVTAKTTDTKFRTIEVIYYPDAAAIEETTIKNVNWKNEIVPKYNLDPNKWNVDKENGQKPEDLMAKSPNRFKSFYTSADFKKGDIAVAPIVGMGENAHARDSADIDRGDTVNGNPIDFALPGCKFLGWALYSTGSWKASGTGVLRVVVYALWERNAAAATPDENEDEEKEPEAPKEYATPIQATLAKWLAKIAEIFEWLKLAPSIPVALTKLLNDNVYPWLYEKLGIEIEA